MRHKNCFNCWIWQLRWRIRSFFSKKGIEIGERLPNFSLKDLQGREVTLYRCFPEKCVLLWLTNLCSVCEEKIPFLERLRQKYQEEVEILAISVLGKDLETPQRIREKHHFEFSFLLDSEDWVGRVLGFVHPENTCPLYNLLLLSRSGQVVFRSHLSAVEETKLIGIIESSIGKSHGLQY